MPSWPASLPQEFERPGYRDSLPGRTVGTAIQGGDPLARETSRRPNRAPMVGAMLVTTVQWETLLAFYRADIGDGALAFDFPDPDDGDAAIPVAFTAPPELTTIGGDFHSARIALERQD